VGARPVERADIALDDDHHHRVVALERLLRCRPTQAARVLDQGHSVELLRETGSIDVSPLAGVLGWVRTGSGRVWPAQLNLGGPTPVSGGWLSDMQLTGRMDGGPDEHRDRRY
jgi:hypothetical protein